MNLKQLAVGAVSVALAALAGPAFAVGPPYSVSVGGSSAAGAHAITAQSSGAVKISAQNATGTILNLNCSSVAGAGRVTSGTGVNPVATITSTTWSGCSFIGPFTFSQTGTWNVEGTGANATSGTESVAGAVANVTLGIQSTSNPRVCRFTVTGAPSSSFDEATQQLVVDEVGYTGNLKLSGVSGCLGRLQNGNAMDFQATLNVTSPDGAINLS